MNAWKALAQTAANSAHRLARLHALWGLGQIVRTGPASPPVQDLLRLLPLLDDSDPEVQGHAALLLGQAHLSQSQTRLRQLIERKSVV